MKRTTHRKLNRIRGNQRVVLRKLEALLKKRKGRSRPWSPRHRRKVSRSLRNGRSRRRSGRRRSGRRRSGRSRSGRSRSGRSRSGRSRNGRSRNGRSRNGRSRRVERRVEEPVEEPVEQRSNEVKMSISDKKPCTIINSHDEKILVPKSYPGDEWVHANLMPDRHLHIDSFQEDQLKDKYNFYRRVCYGNN
jgi:hypothetical protein